MAQFGKLKIGFLMYRVWFLMYRNNLIQMLRAGSVGVPESAGKCPLLQAPLPPGWAEIKGITSLPGFKK